jgi:hypothetical protein
MQTQSEGCVTLTLQWSLALEQCYVVAIHAFPLLRGEPGQEIRYSRSVIEEQFVAYVTPVVSLR